MCLFEYLRSWLARGLVPTVAVAAIGCAQGTAPPTAETGSLAERVAIAAHGASVDGQVTFTIAGGYASPRPETMSIGVPELSVRSGDGRATLEALRLPLGDIDVPAAALPPRGLQLRDLVLTAEPTRATVVHAETDALELHTSLPLVLDWTLLLQDGTRYPLGAVHTQPIDLDVRVFRSDGQVTATVDARCSGTCWSIDGLARLSDGAVHLEAAADVTAAP